MDHKGERESGTNIDLGPLKPFSRRDEPPNHYQGHTEASVSIKKIDGYVEMLTVHHRQHKSNSLLERSNRFH
jgi:hypothetical protein